MKRICGILGLCLLCFLVPRVQAAVTFDSTPANALLECAQGLDTSPSATGSPTASTDCPDQAGPVDITYEDAVDAQCGNSYVITRTWTATDACQDTATYVQTITVHDSTPPVFDSVPEDTTVECGDSTDPSATGQPTASDTCGSANITYADTSVPGCGDTETITRTWTATDDCGNTATYDQEITVEDTTAPTFTSFPNATTVIFGGSTDPADTGQPTATDGCGTVALSHDDSWEPACGGGGTLTRTWTARDACNNTVSDVQIITVQDNPALVWENAFEEFRYAVDNNGGYFFQAPGAFTEQNPKESSTNVDGESGSYNDTVSTSHDQLNNTVHMEAWAQGTGTMGSPDHGLKVRGYAQMALNGFDPSNSGVDVTQTAVTWITRRFTVDTGGTYNLAALLKGMVDFNQFGDENGNYYSAYSVTGTATIDAFEALGGEPITNLPWNLPEITLNAVNNDGGTRTGNQDVVLLDKTPGGADIIYELRIVLTIQSRLKNLSLVGGNPVITTPPGSTEILGTYMLGSSGSPLELEASLCYVGDLPDTPYFLYIPADKTAECGHSNPQDTGTAQATGGCGGLSVIWEDSVDPGCGNSGVITRTWTATDSCQNSTSATQVITVVDTVPPRFDAIPGDVSVECGDPMDPGATGSPQASDDCGGVTLAYTDSQSSGCGSTEVITRTWTATDECGNVATYVQTITVEDTTVPVFSVMPPDVSVECGESTDPADTGLAEATDGCGGVVVDYTDSFAAGCGGGGVITRTWTATDDCGNTANYEQRITIEDTQAPTWVSSPFDTITVECGESTDPSAVGEAQATDSCSPVLVAYTDSMDPGCGSSGVITRTWSATDDCGNTATALVQTINIVDSRAPVFTYVPPDTEVEAGGNTHPSITGYAEASDECGKVTVSFSDSWKQGPREGTGLITRTWTATDECENSASATQRIWVGMSSNASLPGLMLLLGD